MELKLEDINNSLKARKPAVVKTPTATAKKLDVATLRLRIIAARKALDQLLANAQELQAPTIADQIRALSAKLCQLERQLASAHGRSTRLVRLVQTESKRPGFNEK